MSERLSKELKKLAKKDPRRAEILMKKVEEILEEPERYKCLRGPLSGFRRVHIDSHFVLVFSIDKANRVVNLEDFGHHDKVYKTNS